MKFESDPSLRHLAWHAATCLASHTGLESGGQLWREAGEGLCQGDPEVSSWFCVAWHREVRELNAKRSYHVGLARFGNDDVHDCEVYGLFADLVPAQVEVLQWGRARPGLNPNFRL